MPELNPLTTDLAQACPFWTKEQWRVFLYEMTADEQATVAQALEDSAVPPSQSNGWNVALGILTTAATVVGAITGIGSGVTVIQQIVKGA